MYIVYKQIGETPLACIQRIFGKKHAKYTYAGRLDPMAEGLLLVLVDDECREAKHYFNLTKTYTYTCTIGIATDTYDCLGRISAYTTINDAAINEKVRNAVKTLSGNILLPYPPYSSKTVNGEPLFIHARRATVHTTPKRIMTVLEHRITEESLCETAEIAERATAYIAQVRGNFRQESILEDWQKIPNTSLPCFSATITGGGGLYVRAVVNAIGKYIGYPTVTTSITRTAIGQWTIQDVYGQ